jgi:hypothetical protein
MSDDCRYEADVILAATGDAWSEALREHVAACESCAAAAEVAPWMHDFARIDERQKPLPDPAVLFLKAKLMQSATAVERATMPITRLHIAAYLIVAAGWATLLTWKRTALVAWAQTLDPGHVVSGSASAPLSAAVLFCAIALASATVMLAFHTVLAEE